MIRLIKSEAEYSEALSELDRLVERDPAPGTPEADHLELLSLIVRDYESRHFPRHLPSPLEAIRFRMEQQGLSRKDLVPYLGSRSKVSEVLAGKRTLTLSMIKALHKGLGIPAEALLHDQPAPDFGDELEWDRFPVREMIRRGWISPAKTRIRQSAEELVRGFLAPLGAKRLYAFYRRTHHVRGGGTIDKYALIAWTSRVAIRSFERSTIMTQTGLDPLSPDQMRELAQLSWSAQGPLLAQEYLEQHGIALVVEPQLPKTRLDGASMLLDSTRPVIGLTLRHDRIDSFWFSLMHELAHVLLHLKHEGESFYDDLDADPAGDPIESNADELAGDTLIPKDAWDRSPARHLRSPDAAEHLAKTLRIHPAIVAGRMRHEARNYRILPHLVGQGQVRKLFSEVKW